MGRYIQHVEVSPDVVYPVYEADRPIRDASGLKCGSTVDHRRQIIELCPTLSGVDRANAIWMAVSSAQHTYRQPQFEGPRRGVGFRIPAALLQRLDRLKEQSGKTRTEVLVEAIKAYIDARAKAKQ